MKKKHTIMYTTRMLNAENLTKSSWLKNKMTFKQIGTTEYALHMSAAVVSLCVSIYNLRPGCTNATANIYNNCTAMM